MSQEMYRDFDEELQFMSSTSKNHEDVDQDDELQIISSTLNNHEDLGQSTNDEVP